jgi:hypothetical protein
MDQPLTPIQKLDEVLRYLSNAKPDATDGDIFSSLQATFPALKEQNDLGSDIHRILDKLKKDGYIDSHIPNRNLNPTMKYFITFEGLLFLNEQGGYKRKAEKDELDFKNREIEVRIRRRNEKWMTLGTILVAIATFGLLFWELYKYYRTDRK